MPKAKRVSMTIVNHNVRCQLCTGYLVDATTIIECLHSFCRSCIVRYLESSKYCPICDVQVHKTRPLLNIRSDKTLQALVYKIVPELFKNEMRRRKEFYEKNPQPVSEGAMTMLSKEEKGDMDGSLIFTADEKFSVCIQHTTSEPPFRNHSCGSMPFTDQDEGDHKRFLLCPATFTIGLLKKFILAKYGLNQNYRVGIVHSDELLDEDFTLIDIAYIYGWRRLVPLKLYYLILDITTLPKPRQLPPPSPEKEKEINVVEIPVEKGVKGRGENNVAKSVTVLEAAKANVNMTQDSGISAKVEVPKDDSDKNHVEISVSEECSDQAMDLSVPQKRDTDGSESVVSISSSSSMDNCSIEDMDSESVGSGTKEIEEEIQREIRGYQKQAMKSKLLPNNTTTKSVPDSQAAKSKSTMPKSSILTKTNDESLQNTINNILEVLNHDNAKSDDEEKSDKAVNGSLDTSTDSKGESLSQSEDKSEPMDTNDQSDDSLKIVEHKEPPPTETESSDNDPDKSSDSLQNLVIIEPEKWKVERCESVHSDKENQSVSPTIVDIIPVNSNLPKIEKIDKYQVEKGDKFEPKESKETPEDNPDQCSVVVPPAQVPQPVYTVQSLQPPMVPVPTKPLTMKPTKLANSPSTNDPRKRGPNGENVMDGIVKRKRGRPPKVPKDPSQCTPPKIARILPKGVPPQSMGGFFPNGLNMAQGQFPMQFPMQFPTMNQTLPNGQVVRVFVQNVQNMAAGQTGGQMMVNGQQIGQQMNMQQQGINPQFMNQQMMNGVNGQPMMNTQQFQMTNQQQQQQMAANMNMNAINMNNQMQMVPQSSMANATIVQENTNNTTQNTIAGNHGNSVQVVSSGDNQVNTQSAPASVAQSGQVPGGMVTQMATQGQFNQQMQTGTLNPQMAGRQMLQPSMPGAPLMNTQMTTGAQGGAHHALPVSLQNSVNVRPGISQNFQATSKMAQLLSQPLQNPRMMFPGGGGRQPGYPPAPRMPPLPTDMKINNNPHHKTMKSEKPGITSSSGSFSTSATSTKSTAPIASSSMSTHVQSSTTESTGLNNGYDAPLELTTKKEPAALEKLSAMQPPIAS